MSGSSLEIERVWILDGLPEIPVDAQCWRIRQGYLAEPTDDEPFTDDPNIVPRVGRIRSIEDSDGSMRFMHTIKRGTGLVRIEMERDLSDEAFHSAWPGTSGRRLTKTRWRVHDAQHTWGSRSIREPEARPSGGRTLPCPGIL